MSYRERWARKHGRAKTPEQMRREATRDLRFCQRWGIDLEEAWKWNRYPLENYGPAKGRVR